MSQFFRMNKLISLISFIVLMGCATAQQPAATFSIEGKISAASLINPTLKGEAAPVNIFILELKKIKTFQSSSFFSLHNDIQAVLGEDLIHIEKMSIVPGKILVVPKRKLNENTRYIAVVASFRSWKDSKWRDIMSISGSKIKYRVGIHSHKVDFLLTLPEIRTPGIIEV